MTEKSTYFSIKNWSEDDRPREKLLHKGAKSLSDAELIATLIGSGHRNESAVELAKRILRSSYNNLNQLGRFSVNQLMQFRGIGSAKAIAIVAALELGRRRRLQQALTQKKIDSSEGAFEIMQPVIGDLTHEEFWIIYLNNSNKVIQKLQLSKGGITGTLVDVRLALKYALELNAVGIIISHNHPSGTLIASNSDKRLTRKIKTACDALDIKLLDHIIVTEKAYFSFADEGFL